MTSKIEWLRSPDGKPGYTINPVKGLCPVACPYCYARRMYKWHKWNKAIRFELSVFNDLPKMKPGSKVFWGSTMELFGDWIDPDGIRFIMGAVRRHPELTHIFLTKRPENLSRWSPFPDNCWVGVSVTKKIELYPAIYALADIKCGKRFLSFEPLLENVFDQILPAEWDDAIDWVILGQLTPVNPKTAPEYAWIEAIVDAADKANIPVFIKNNLNTCAISDHPNLVDYASGMLRQEFPEHREVRRNNSGNGKRGVPCGKNGGNAPTSPTLQVKGLSPDQKPLVNIGILTEDYCDMED